MLFREQIVPSCRKGKIRDARSLFENMIAVCSDVVNHREGAVSISRFPLLGKLAADEKDKPDCTIYFDTVPYPSRSLLKRNAFRVISIPRQSNALA